MLTNEEVSRRAYEQMFGAPDVTEADLAIFDLAVRRFDTWRGRFLFVVDNLRLPKEQVAPQPVVERQVEPVVERQVEPQPVVERQVAPEPTPEPTPEPRPQIKPKRRQRKPEPTPEPTPEKKATREWYARLEAFEASNDRLMVDQMNRLYRKFATYVDRLNELDRLPKVVEPVKKSKPIKKPKPVKKSKPVPEPEAEPLDARLLEIQRIVAEQKAWDERHPETEPDNDPEPLDDNVAAARRFLEAMDSGDEWDDFEPEPEPILEPEPEPEPIKEPEPEPKPTEPEPEPDPWAADSYIESVLRKTRNLDLGTLCAYFRGEIDLPDPGLEPKPDPEPEPGPEPDNPYIESVLEKTRNLDLATQLKYFRGEIEL